MARYREAGVDLEAADRHLAEIGPLVTATWPEQAVGGFGGFAAGLPLPAGFRRPVLVMSTDGVGTKLDLIRRTGRWEGVGFDLVAMCVDDLVAVGARPLALTDYLAVGRLDPDRDRAIVASVAAACATAGITLLGGETAEHPGVVEPHHVDLAGTALGVMDHDQAITGEAVATGDPIVGVASPNLRSNGFSLVRAVTPEAELGNAFPGTERTVGEMLIEPSVIYAPAVTQAVATGGVRALAHITGGGLPGNLIRALPEGKGAVIRRATWQVPAVFRWLQERGGIPVDEMFRTFNMGIGYVAVTDPDRVDQVTGAFAEAGHEAAVIGEVVAGEHTMRMV